LRVEYKVIDAEAAVSAAGEALYFGGAGAASEISRAIE
jgi:hypothetical protein